MQDLKNSCVKLKIIPINSHKVPPCCPTTAQNGRTSRERILCNCRVNPKEDTVRTRNRQDKQGEIEETVFALDVTVNG